MPCLLFSIAEVRAILVLEGIDELLRDRTIVVTFLHIGSSLGVESLGTLHEQVGTAQLFPAVPLAQQLACTLVEDEVNQAVFHVGDTQFAQDGLIFGGQLVIAGYLQIGSIGSALDAGREIVCALGQIRGLESLQVIQAFLFLIVGIRIAFTQDGGTR